MGNDSRIENDHPLYLVVGDQRVSPCDHETYARFKLWVAETLTDGKIDCYTGESVVIEHWDDTTYTRFPNLLTPAEIGTYLPIDVDPCPMLSSTEGLIGEIDSLQPYRDRMEPAFRTLMDAIREMAACSVRQQQPMEIR